MVSKQMKTLPIALCILSLLSASTIKAHAADTPILLGQSAAFSGGASHFGQQTWLGAETYFEELNRNGGINGRPIQVIVKDDAYNPDLTEKNTKDFIAQSDLFALFSYVGTPTVVKALPLIAKSREEKSGLFLFANRTGAKQQRTPPYDEMVFNIRAPYSDEGEAIVKSLAARKKSRVGIFIQDDAYGQSGKAALQAALDKRGLSILGEEKYQRGAKFSESMQAQAKKLQELKVDAIVSIASYAPAAAFIRDARDAGFKGPIVNISFVGAQDMLNLLIEAGKQAKRDYTKEILVSQILPPLSQKTISVVKEYLDLTEKHLPKIPDAISHGEEVKHTSIGGLEGFVNAKVFAAIAKKAKQPLTRESFLAAANDNFSLDLGLSEPVRFSAKDHQGLHLVWMTEVKKGQFVLEN